MDLGLGLIAALIGAGYYLSGGNKAEGRSDDNTLRQSIPKSEKPTGDNIYESHNYAKVDKQERKMVDKNWEASQNPEQTKIIPPFFNALGGHVLNYNPVKNTEVNPVINNLSRLRSDIGTDIKYDSRGIPQKSLEGFTVSGVQNSSNPAVHNNMTPFFRGAAKQNLDPYAHQTTMEAFTGQTQNVSEYRAQAKNEIPAMFAPQGGLTYTYGTPNVGDYGRDRYITSELKTNVKLPEIRVGPGVNDNGYKSAPRDGFHPLYRPVPRNIDELRVNKRTILPQRMNHPQKGTRRGVIGHMQKKTPDTYYENQPARWFTTTGDTIASASRENFNASHTNRAETTSGYTGISGNGDLNGTYTVGDTRLPHRQNTGPISPANISSIGRTNDINELTGYKEVNSMLIQERSGDCCEYEGTEEALGAQRIGVYSNSGNIAQFERARTTGKETVNNGDYIGVAGPNGNDVQGMRDAEYNADVTDLKEVTLQGRAPGGFGGAMNVVGAENINANSKTREMYNPGKRNDSGTGDRQYYVVHNKDTFGSVRNTPNKTLSEIGGVRQPYNYLTEQFRDNPYTKSLQSAPSMIRR